MWKERVRIKAASKYWKGGTALLVEEDKLTGLSMVQG